MNLSANVSGSLAWLRRIGSIKFGRGFGSAHFFRARARTQRPPAQCPGNLNL